MEKTASEIVTVKKNIRLQEWNRQIEEQKASGLSVPEWCIQNGINLKTYYYHTNTANGYTFLQNKNSSTQRNEVLMFWCQNTILICVTEL